MKYVCFQMNGPTAVFRFQPKDLFYPFVTEENQMAMALNMVMPVLLFITDDLGIDFGANVKVSKYMLSKTGEVRLLLSDILSSNMVSSYQYANSIEEDDWIETEDADYVDVFLHSCTEKYSKEEIASFYENASDEIRDSLCAMLKFDSPILTSVYKLPSLSKIMDFQSLSGQVVQSRNTGEYLLLTDNILYEFLDTADQTPEEIRKYPEIYNVIVSDVSALCAVEEER